MEKTKEIPKKIQNGEKTEVPRSELIEQVERRVEQIKSEFHHWSGYLACLKEDN